jgi:hypothetical protein
MFYISSHQHRPDRIVVTYRLPREANIRGHSSFPLPDCCRVLWLVWVALVANAAGIVCNTLLVQRWRRLDTLMFRLCCQAFEMRHLPLWQAWSEAMGADLEIKVTPIPRQTRTGAA